MVRVIGRNDQVIGRNDQVIGRNDQGIGRNDQVIGRNNQVIGSYWGPRNLARSRTDKIDLAPCEISQD